MTALEGAFPSLMQGVSQQTHRERQPGQLTSQENMLSDVVRGLRRRPGMRYLYSMSNRTAAEAISSALFATSVEVGDTPVHVLVNTATGRLRVVGLEGKLLHDTVQPYLVANSSADIQSATLRGEMFLCNTTMVPRKIVSNAGRQDPTRTGFFFGVSGAYSKMYNVIINFNGTSYTGTHTVATGLNAGDAAKATPDYIITQLILSLRENGLPDTVNVVQAGAYAFVAGSSGKLSISSDSGTAYMLTSGNSRVSTVSQLPARMPAIAEGMLVAVGNSDKTVVWYKWNSTDSAWNETGAYGSATGLANMPIALSLDGNYSINSGTYEGREAGNDETNEDPEFLTVGITGISAFQGRLILLAGPNVVASAAGYPRRYYRSTVTTMPVGDAFSIYSGAATTTNFKRATPYNKDLLLFSPGCQAVIPAGGAAINSGSAQIVITSSYSCTVNTSPVVTGRSLLYYAPRSDSYAGVLEMVPSSSTDSQYTTNDATAHLPTYFPGNVVQVAASTTTNQVAVLTDTDRARLVVQDYLWTDEGKQQAAWHSWTLPGEVAAVWFVKDALHVAVLGEDSTFIVCDISASAGSTFGDGVYYRPMSDMYQTVTVSGGKFTVPVSLRKAVSAGHELLLTVASVSDEMRGERVGFSLSGNTGTVVRNVPDGVYCVGVRFSSSWSPTPPQVRDESGTVIGTARTLLTRYELTTETSSTFQVLVKWRGRTLEDGDYSVIKYSSDDLLPNYPIVGGTDKLIVPVRALSQDTAVEFACDTEHDMICLTLEYVLQYNQRRRRVT